MLKDPETVLERVVRFLGQDPGLLQPVPAVRPMGTCNMSVCVMGLVIVDSECTLPMG